MADEKKRITALTEKSALDSGDYMAIDNGTGGTKKHAIGATIGDMSSLRTITKSSLVGAINEVALNGGGGGGGGLTYAAKLALLQIASKVAYIDANGQDYYDDLYDALFTEPVPATAISLSSNSLSFSTLNATQQLTASLTPSDTTDTVTWTSSDTAKATVSNSGLVTSKGVGSCTITATAGSVSATCSVVVSQATLSSISAVYTQSGTVYDTDSLDSLKSDLVVTAHWSNSTTSTVADADYTLSGTLTAGTSTITVSYGGKTTTFTVTVTADPSHTESVLATMVPGTDFTYVSGSLSPSTGVVTEDAESNYRTTELITIPTGATSFSFAFTKKDINSQIVWYDSTQTYIGAGYGNTYSGNGQYGDGFTYNNDLWHCVPSNAKYVRIQWRPSDNTFSQLVFMHNIKLDESVTPVANKLYYYTFTTSSTSANTDDYLPCSGMAYAQVRAIYRRGYTLYASDKSTVSTQSVANNIGNNIQIPSGVSFIRPGNTTNNSAANNGLPTRIGIGLIMFTEETKTSW